MSKRRFVAPARADVPPACFGQPIFADYRAFMPWLLAEDWPDCAQLDQAMPIATRYFVPQTRELLADGLHYEARIAQQGAIATRMANWHDLFNAMVWCRWPAVKQAINARQYGHIGEMGPKIRNRAQYALTQFDEAGVIVRLRRRELLPLWDAHDWPALFYQHATAWQCGDIAIAAVIGHALMEHALSPGTFMVGKAIVVQDEDAEAAVQIASEAIASGQCLQDPLELRPLPLSGIPGWHAGQSEAFYRSAACFQPCREGRHYPVPLARFVGQGVHAGLG